MLMKKFFAGLVAALVLFTHPVFAIENAKNKKVLFVVSSLDKKAPNLVGGFWFPELTHPVEVFDQASIGFDIASPKGGLAPFDGFELNDHANLSFWTNPEHRNKLGNTLKLSAVDPSKYDAILLVGGHGPMWDFVGNPELDRLVRTFYERSPAATAPRCRAANTGPVGARSARDRLRSSRKFSAFRRIL